MTYSSYQVLMRTQNSVNESKIIFRYIRYSATPPKTPAPLSRSHMPIFQPHTFTGLAVNKLQTTGQTRGPLIYMQIRYGLLDYNEVQVQVIDTQIGRTFNTKQSLAKSGVRQKHEDVALHISLLLFPGFYQLFLCVADMKVLFTKPCFPTSYIHLLVCQ